MESATTRLRALDVIRGIVMVLMALDHVRVFAGVPAGGPTPALYFTRWITNFCAPAFVFLAGTGAFLHGRRLPDVRSLSRYLAVRGAILVVLEMTVSRLSWTFNLDFYNYTEANVLWAIGWSMILLAVLIHVPRFALAVFTALVIAGHDVTSYFQTGLREMLSRSPFAHLFQILYFGGEFRWFDTGPKLVVLYSIVPWVGVIAAGYLFGAVMTRDPVVRRRVCLRLGLGATALFIVLRATNLYGNPWPWSAEGGFTAGALSFLGTSKYPASLQFLLMTLGPTIAAIPLLETASGWVAARLVVFGRVPLFYYLIHIPVIHAVALLISLVRSPAATWWLFENHPLRIPPPPDGYRWSLLMLWTVTLVVVVLLYFPCRWYAAKKTGRRDAWYRYI